MKIAIINDTHIGVRNDNPIFREFQEKFFKEVFFPYIDKYDIKTIIHAGDLFDKRKTINFITLHEWNRFFTSEIVKRNVELHITVGNHDIAWRESNHVNSPSLLLGNFPNFYIYKSCKTVSFDGVPICLIPWINKENYDESMSALSSTPAQIAIGHLEIQGFEMHKGSMCEHGLESKILNRFDIVLSGHFHTRSSKGNITYMGSQYETCWSDFNDQKGFHVLDTETREIEFIPNENYLYYKIYYNDETKDFDKFPIPKLEKKFVKVIVENKKNPKMFNRFIDKINKIGAYEIQVVEEVTLEELNSGDKIDLSKDTSEIISDFIDNLDLSQEKTDIKNIMSSLYNEAITMEY